MSGLEITLAVAALLAGFCGTWSPCGFSMIETIGPHGHSGGRATTLSACVTFTLGALVGGVFTFAALGWLGSLLQGAEQSAAYVLGAVIAVVAAALEIRGVPILPQLRRQLPEHWRRVMPMPVAAGLYGILLGLGFTTFVLTFGVFALAGDLIRRRRSRDRRGHRPRVRHRPGAAHRVCRPDRRPRLRRGDHAGDGRPAGHLSRRAASATASRSSRLPRRSWWSAPAGSRPHRRPAGRGPVGLGQAPSSSSGPTAPASCAEAARRPRLPGHDPAIGDGRIAVISRGQIAGPLGEGPQRGRTRPRAAAPTPSRSPAVARLAGPPRRHDYMRAARPRPARTRPAASEASASPARSRSSGARASTATASSTRARAARENSIVSRRLGAGGPGARRRCCCGRASSRSRTRLGARRRAALRARTPAATASSCAPISAPRPGPHAARAQAARGTLWSTALTPGAPTSP